MPREKEYQAQLETLGVWEEAFAPALHSLCIMERELSRTQKAWKATASKNEAPSVLNPLYGCIQTQRRDINALRDALGLTPKGLQKLRGKSGVTPESEGAAISSRLDALLQRVSGYE